MLKRNNSNILQHRENESKLGRKGTNADQDEICVKLCTGATVSCTIFSSENPANIVQIFLNIDFQGT